MRRLFLAALATVSLAASFGLPARAAAATTPVRVAIIVGPVGSLTPTYLHFAELAAAEAELRGADVARAYSPNATPANVLAAVDGAHIVIYFGHGYGHPSPYGGLDTARQNGWALQGPRARGTHGDGLNGELAYYGEDWIVANARPAAGFVMIYSNVCYAPGASEGGHAPATESTALQRVAHYSRKVFRMGGSAYYAVDFDRGAADLVARMLDNRRLAYGALFATDHRYVASALRAYGHPFSSGRQVWLHRAKYTDGPPNYWYAFAGRPDAVPARSWDPVAPTAKLAGGVSDVIPDATLRLELSETVVGLDQATWRLTDLDGEAVPADVRVDAASGEASLHPVQPLELSASYRLELLAGITDAAGNPLPPASWELATRLDADALDRELPVVLASGTHELVRLDELGSVVETDSLVVTDERWVGATQRARLPGRAGSWLELGTGALTGWWVAESSAARAIGLLDAATYPEPVTLELPAGEYSLHEVADGAAAMVGELLARSPRPIRIDRRVVADGHLLLRVTPNEPSQAGRWIRVASSSAPAEAEAQRILADGQRTEPASLRLGLGNWTLFRFDATGRVVERQVVSGGRLAELRTSRTVDVGGTIFFVVSGGKLDGWAVREHPLHTVLEREVPATSAE